MNTSYWIWYPGDFELYHAMVQNFSRIERGCRWPAFWKSEGFRNRVAFRREYTLSGETTFVVYSQAAGHVCVDEKKYPFGETVTCGPGTVKLAIHAGCIETFPSIYIKGDVICSDEKWQVEDYANGLMAVGYSRYFTGEAQNPAVWDYSETVYEPVCIEPYEGGVLYEFETELTAVLEVSDRQKGRTLRAFCGESREEALDMEHCYYSWQIDRETGRCPRCALRYVYIPDCAREDLTVRAIHQYIDIPVRGRFRSSDGLLNEIWSVAAHTFSLCSGVFFIDGIKRDKWIWGGDAYQSLFVNQYFMADADINRRTLLALRGNDPMTTHINTIVDYTLYWVLSIRAHEQAYGDADFVRQVYPKLCSLMEFCEGQTDENGFLTGRPGDWIFIDWADLDKEGALCAEQMLFAACYETMLVLGRRLEKAPEEWASYEKAYRALREKIDAFYWNEEKGAYIDSFASGKDHVTRHANIFAILFDLADAQRKARIVETVLHNDAVAQITTPYFKFFELDVLCRMGCLDEVLSHIRTYWGGMLERGAVTFWEEYDPRVTGRAQYDMYGDKFGKSLCHAWSASPIYLLARYFVGLKVTDAQAGSYELSPHLEQFSNLECVLPVGQKDVHIVWDGRELTVEEWTDGTNMCTR
ncbi:amylo-alpha-1,6-glucosidase [Lachnospiraceae bacterium 47-T17]